MTADTGQPVLVVGGGLLGGAVISRLGPAATRTGPIVWDAPTDAARGLRALGAGLASGPGWRAAWCAGAGVVGASAGTMRRERDALRAFLDGLADGGEPGRLFVASSAGGLHGRGGPRLITEASPPSPCSEYGEGKLVIEHLVVDWAERTATPTLVGRISNLYGPGQNLAKAQGLVSHLCRNALCGRPTELRVPLETTRDFLHTDDAAARIVDWLGASGDALGGSAATVKLIVSGVPTTLARAVALVRAVGRRRMLLVHVDDGRRAEQPLYLRFRSTVLPELDAARPPRPLEVGIAEVFEALRRQRAAGFAV